MGKIVDSALLTEARTTFNMAFKNAYRDPAAPGPLVQLLCGAVKPSAGASTKYPILGQLTGLREWIGPRQFEDLARYAYELKNRTFEKGIEIPVNDFADDQYEAYTDAAAQIGHQCRIWPEDLVISALQAGGSSLCFDGQYFFDTDHPVDPANAGSTTYANKFTSTALTSANFSSTLATMQQIKGRDGRPVGGFRSKLALIVPPQLRETGKNIVEAEFLSSGASNVNKGVAELVVEPRLGNEAAVWYLADMASPFKPMLFQMREEPSDIVALTSKSDPNVFNEDVYRWGVKARGAAGYALPWLLARCEG